MIIIISININNANDSIFFFTAKSTVKLVQNNTENTFDAHIRFNLKDTLWMSFTGPFGIEGARMLITKDSTFIINKLEKKFTAISTNSENEYMPYVFNFEDWKMILLGFPFAADSQTNILKNEEVVDQIHYNKDQIKKLTFKNKLIHSCEFSHTKNKVNCKIEFVNHTPSKSIPDEREIRIKQDETSSYLFSMKFEEYEFNKPSPFTFNVSKYRYAE